MDSIGPTSDAGGRGCAGAGSAADWFAARAAVYCNLFGPEAEVVRSRPGAADAVAVDTDPPGHGRREFYTLVTNGLSDAVMRAPADAGAPRRIELVTYVDQPGPTILRLLESLARLVRSGQAWLGHGHTLPNGDPPAPLFTGSRLDTVLLLLPIVEPERHMPEHVRVADDPLHLLWLFPITSAECRLKVEYGVQALLDRFNERQVSFVLDPGRESLV